MEGCELLHQARTLIEQEQYQSASILCSFVASSVGDGADTQLLQDLHVACGDALLNQRQYHRALHFYKLAFDRQKRGKPFDVKHQNTMKQPEVKSKNGEPSLRIKMAKACMAIGGEGMDTEALEHLRSIEPHHRTLPVIMMLGKLYRSKGAAKTASEYYWHALTKNKWCLEALKAYIELFLLQVAGTRDIAARRREWNEGLDRINALYDTKGGKPDPTSAMVLRWINIQHLKLSSRMAEAVQVVREPSTITNPYIACDVAECYHRCGATPEALSTFSRLRSSDPYFISGLDILSTILKQQGMLSELRRLSSDTISFAPNSFETWLIAAVARSASTQSAGVESHPDRVVIDYAKKAIRINPSSHRGYLLMASLLMSSNRVSDAVKYYMRAQCICRDIPSYQGLVYAFLKDRNSKAALATAKEATMVFPDSPISWTLVGHVYQGLLKVKAAKEQFGEALKRDPRCLDAIIPLCDMECEEGKSKEAILRLKGEVQSEQVLLKLASILVVTKDFAGARGAYQDALNLNPYSHKAREGLRMLDELEMDETSEE